MACPVHVSRLEHRQKPDARKVSIGRRAERNDAILREISYWHRRNGNREIKKINMSPLHRHACREHRRNAGIVKGLLEAGAQAINAARWRILSLHKHRPVGACSKFRLISPRPSIEARPPIYHGQGWRHGARWPRRGSSAEVTEMASAYFLQKYAIGRRGA